MSYWRGLRWSTAWIFLPLILLAAYAGSVSEQEFFGDYPLVATSQAWICLVVVIPLLAGWGAWDASRLRPWLDASMGGAHRIKALARLLGPAIGLAMAGVAAMVLLVAGRPVGPSAWVVTVAAVVAMVGAVLLGTALGMVTSKLAAAPTAVVTTYAAMAIPVANPALWPGRAVLTGTVAPCCASSDQINLRVLATVVMASVLVAVSALLPLILPLDRVARGGTLALALGVSVLVAWAMTSKMEDHSQIVSRTTTPVCHEGDQGQVCVWPEHVKALPQIRQFVRQATTAARTLGMDLPNSWSEKTTPGTVTFVWASDGSKDQHKYALGLDIAHWAGCSGPEDEADVASYLALRMGTPASELSEQNPDAASTVTVFSSLSEHSQRQLTLQRVHECRR